MSVPGPWETPPALGRFLGRIGSVQYDSAVPGAVSGITQGSSNSINPGLLRATSLHSDAQSQHGYLIAQITERLHSTTSPPSFGAFYPPGAVGFEWETPTAPLTIVEAGIPSPSQTSDVNALALVDAVGARSAVQLYVTKGFLPPSGIVLSGNTVTAAPALDDPGALAVDTSYVVPAGSGTVSGPVESPWSRLTPVTAPGWLVYGVVVADTIAGSPPSGYDFATLTLNNYKSCATYYQAGRFRWLYDDAPVATTYGWGVLLG